MKQKLTRLIPCLLILLCCGFNIPNNASFGFKIKVNPVVTSYTDMEVELLFFAKKNKLTLPKDIYYGYAEDEDADVVFEVEKKDALTFKVQTPIGNYSYPNIIVNGKEYDTLFQNKTKAYVFPLYTFYEFTRGVYKVRAKFIVPKQNNKMDKIVYSNWVTFKVDTDRITRYEFI